MEDLIMALENLCLVRYAFKLLIQHHQNVSDIDILQGSDKSIYKKELNTRINMTFGSTQLTKDWATSRGIKIEKVHIHPDYWQDTSKHGNPYDLALVKTNVVKIIELYF